MIDIATLKKRIISAVILIPIVLLVIYIGGWIFNVFAILTAILLTLELVFLLQETKQLKLLKKWLPYIALYITLPTASLISLRSIPGGIDATIYVFCIVWLTDIFGFFGGKNFGGPKLAANISPNKTISGAISAIIATILFSIVSYLFTEKINFFSFILIGIIFSIVSQIGDLFESWVKRKLKVKDSGNIILGHGGLFDRVDGLLFVLPIASLVFCVLNSNIF